MTLSKNIPTLVRFLVLVAVNMMMAVSCGVSITLMMKAVSTSETSVNFYQTAWCKIPEDSRHLIQPIQS
jgi:hypothetical protein